MLSRKEINIMSSNLPTLNLTPHEIPPYRQKILKKFTQLLDHNEKLGEECELELSKYVMTISGAGSKFQKEYLKRGINLCRNLDPTGSLENDYLQPKVVSGEIEPYKLVRMTDQELYPPKWKEINDRHMEDISRLDEDNKMVTQGLYTCGKCKENKCSYYQLQTRSCDEPTTTFVTCVNCGNKWRE